MVGKKMVFVLGAGASKPYGFPLGDELRERILTDTVLPQSPLNHGDFEPFKTAFAESGAESIDAFLESGSAYNYEQIGKWAIAEKVMSHERRGALFMDARDDNWLSYLFNSLLLGMRDIDEVFDLPLSFVTFNYDRSVEFYISTALQTRFKATDDEIKSVFKRIEVIHVYGDLGPLPGHPREGVDWTREYAPVINEFEVCRAASQIKVIHEARDTSLEFDLARQLMRAADSIYLLGFGYHPTNMRRLQLPFDRCTGVKGQIDQITGTALNLTPVEVAHFEKRLYKGLCLGDTTHKSRQFLRHNDEFLRNVSEINKWTEVRNAKRGEAPPI